MSRVPETATLSITKSLVISLLVASLGLSLAGPAVASAQTTQPPAQSAGQALEIAPPVINLTANPGQTVKTQIQLRDVSPTKLLVTGQVNDFKAAGEDGTPKIILDEDQETEENPYSLKKWFAPLPQLTLEPRQIRNLPVTINVPANASPGGYYAVVRFTATPPDLDSTGVSLSASLGSLVFLRVNGKVTEKLELVEFAVSQADKKASLFQATSDKTPIKFTQRIRNSGNLHEQPAGQVTITDMFGKTVATLNVNLPPRNILPASIRKFEQPLDSSVIGSKKLFGRYKASLKLTYGSDKQTISQETTFWVIPYTLIGIIVVVLIGGFFALRFLLKRYNQRVISRYNHRRR